MHWTHFFILVLATTFAKEEETNEVNIPPKLSANLDANLRRALLKALTELENEENEKKQQRTVESNDKIVEKASASALSFFASTQPSPTTVASTTTEVTHKPIVVIQKSHGLQHRPITTLEKYTDESEQIVTSASSSFTSSSNKVSFPKPESPNSVSDDAKATTKFFRLPKVETTTVTTTTSTEESEAKVEDVQFFSAPLVAAFTVHQDARGLPKSVEPIFRPKIEQKIKQTTFAPTPTQVTLSQQEQVRTQFALQEKQRALEAEILRLKQQQQQQNYLIRQQQILHEQQLQLQKQKILDEQSRIRQNQQFTSLRNNYQQTTQRNEFNSESVSFTQPPFAPLVNNFNAQHTTQRNEFSPLVNNFNDQHTTQRIEFNNNAPKVKGTLVSFQPSLSFTSQQYPSGLLPFNAQQLPVKNPVDFRSSFSPVEHFQQFNYLSHQQPPLEGSVSGFDVVPTVQPQLTLTAPKHHHRVFRQEANSGNFFSNNGFNQVPFQPNSNRFFRSSADNFNRAQPPVVNQQLNHLLYNSGLIRGGKQQEDLNIVSKVLALNHYGGDYRFDSSNVNEQRVPAPLIKKV